ncbi:peptidase inhibitor family I36 protein [Streptomyces sp. JNUCC 64]
MGKLRISSAACAVLLSTVLAPDAFASAAPDSLQQEIDSVLATTTGGVQISRNEIAWDDGRAILAFPLPGETTAPPSSPAARALEARTSGASPSRPTGPTGTVTVVTPQGPGAGVVADEELPPGETEPSDGVSASDNCPTEVFGNDWYCFYQFKNYAGRRLQWNSRQSGVVHFARYAFLNRTSSWSNKGGLTIEVSGRLRSGQDSSCGGAASLLWVERSHSKSASLPNSLDNRADCFRTT